MRSSASFLAGGSLRSIACFTSLQVEGRQFVGACRRKGKWLGVLPAAAGDIFRLRRRGVVLLEVAIVGLDARLDGAALAAGNYRCGWPPWPFPPPSFTPRGTKIGQAIPILRTSETSSRGRRASAAPWRECAVGLAAGGLGAISEKRIVRQDDACRIDRPVLVAVDYLREKLRARLFVLVA